MAIEIVNCHIQMVIFPSYVELPKGNSPQQDGCIQHAGKIILWLWMLSCIYSFCAKGTVVACTHEEISDVHMVLMGDDILVQLNLGHPLNMCSLLTRTDPINPAEMDQPRHRINFITFQSGEIQVLDVWVLCLCDVYLCRVHGTIGVLFKSHWILLGKSQ